PSEPALRGVLRGVGAISGAALDDPSGMCAEEPWAGRRRLHGRLRPRALLLRALPSARPAARVDGRISDTRHRLLHSDDPGRPVPHPCLQRALLLPEPSLSLPMAAHQQPTPLALKLKERIRREGPLSVADYMRACLDDPDHGYYRRRPAIGAAGDFTTAPEISQIFGELIGIWAAVAWRAMGAPARVDLLELGPGRGTMISDALRAARVVPGFLEAIDLKLVESNDALRDAQRQTLEAQQVPISWHESLLSGIA